LPTPPMKLKKNIATSESGFVFNPTTGDSFSLNTIGAEILLQMKDNKTSDDIKKDILNRYEVDKSLLEKDWDDFMAQLRDNNLLDY
ncbi:MAG: PqqD family protein, partial [Bacteroidia bacterium]